MKKPGKRPLWARIGRIVLRVLLVVILLPLLLYVPFIQDIAVGIATKEVKKSTGLDISVERLRLKFPLRVEIDRVAVVQANGDTMVTARSADVRVKFLPLFEGRIDVDYVKLDSAAYQLNNPDSLMWLTARIDRAEIDDTRLSMKFDLIDLDKALIDGARVNLILRPDTAPTPRDTSAVKPLKILGRDIVLKRVTYTMQMLPTIDSLSAFVGEAHLRDGCVDLLAQTVDAKSLSVDSVSAAYFVPADPAPAVPLPTATDAADVKPWTVRADRISLSGKEATYAVAGAKPQPGLDFNFLQATDIAIEVDSFLNRGTTVVVPLRRLEATERCGICLDAHGLFAMDSTLMTAKDFSISTRFSHIDLSAAMGVGDLAANPGLPLRLKADGNIAMKDIALAFPALTPTLSKLPRPGSLKAEIDIHGSPARLDIARLDLSYPGLLKLRASGRVDDAMQPERIAGSIALNGELTGANSLKNTLVDARLGKTFGLPRHLAVKGKVDYRPGVASGDIEINADDGSLAAIGSWAARGEKYEADLAITDFPVAEFLPAFGVDDLTAVVKVNGLGYNPLSPSSTLSADIDLRHVTYQANPYDDITLRASAADGRIDGFLSSGNPDADFDIDFIAQSTDTGYIWDVEGDVRHIDLRAMKLTADTLHGAFSIASRGVYDPKLGDIRAGVTLDDIDLTLPGDLRVQTGKTVVQAALTDSTMQARLLNGDLLTDFESTIGLKEFLARIDRVMPVIDSQIAARSIDVDTINRTLPPLRLAVDMGSDNIAAAYLADRDIRLGNFGLTLTNDSTLSLTSAATEVAFGATRLDTLRFNAVEHNRFLAFNAMINNRPGTLDDFAKVTLNGFLGNNRLGFLIRQNNIKGETGFKFGMQMTIADSTAHVRLVPQNPVIAYKDWTINKDNHLDYNFFTRILDADLRLDGSNSSLHVFTTPPADPNDKYNDLIVDINRLKLQDWLMFSPFAPPIEGSLSANLRVNADADDMTGSGYISLDSLYYDRQRVGDFDIDVNLFNDPRTKAVKADLALMVDSVKTVTVTGSLNDSTAASPFLLDFSMIRFPLSVVNPFLPPATAKVSGMLNGRMEISGDKLHPVFNGFLDFDSAEVKVAMLGSSFRFSEDKIPVENNMVSFDNFAIRACNDNPLTIDGTVDISDLADVKFNLYLNANNTMIVNSNRARGGATVYGKGYIDLAAQAVGDLNFLRVTADATLCENSNVTYELATTSNSLSNIGNAGEMVRFVNFADSSAVMDADSLTRSMALLLDASVTVEEGSNINVDLITGVGNGKVNLQGYGKLDFSMSPLNSGRLTGRYTINQGFVKYSPPLMTEKNFKFVEGSYVAFNGDMLNPILDIHAVDVIKANVTQEGENSRLVNFDVRLNVTNTLQNMNVGFDLSTDDDITVENELQGMSAEQRASQAMNLLLYGVYTGGNTSGNANIGGNALFAFLGSTINSWAAKAIPWVDISFGINQYERTYEGATSMTTSYSYQVSKSLFDDRFKIVVGGNYSTDADADENFSQNLINDISFEYLLNRSGSMYIRLFRHTGYESILEGEITQTGVGFVLKRKLNSLRDIFRFRRPAKSVAIKPEEPRDETD